MGELNGRTTWQRKMLGCGGRESRTWVELVCVCVCVDGVGEWVC